VISSLNLNVFEYVNTRAKSEEMLEALDTYPP